MVIDRQKELQILYYYKRASVHATVIPPKSS